VTDQPASYACSNCGFRMDGPADLVLEVVRIHNVDHAEGRVATFSSCGCMDGGKYGRRLCSYHMGWKDALVAWGLS
jgi:hypothetical protein